MNIESFTLGPVETHAYLLYDLELQQAIVIDPGMGPEPLIQRIREIDCSVSAILLTHAHLDHIGGLEAVRKATGAPVYIHELEKDWLIDPEKNGSRRWDGIPDIVCKPADVILKGGEIIEFLKQKFQVLHTPGHSPGSVSYLVSSMLFSGDVIFAGSIGRYDLYQGDYSQLINSIHQKLLTFSDDTKVFPGHGPQTTIGFERLTNPFVQS